VQANPFEQYEGLLEEYAELHRALLALQQRHLQAKEGIAEHEKALQHKREELQALCNEQTAALELAAKFNKEKQLLSERKRKSCSQMHELDATETSFRDHSKRLCTACGPFLRDYATEANLVTFALVNAAVEKQLKAHMRVVKAFSAANQQDALSRLLSTGDITVKDVIEDLGYNEQDVVECVKALFQNHSEKAEICLRGLMQIGIGKRVLLDAGIAVNRLLAACSHLEVAQALCQALPQRPSFSNGSVVTHIFCGPEIQQYRQNDQFESIYSSELRWDGLTDAKLQYSFKLRLFPNGFLSNTGGISLIWTLTYGPCGEERTWPMPHERCEVVLRVLRGLHAPDGAHEERCMRGGSHAVFRSQVAGAVPQNGSVPERAVGFHMLSTKEASSGHYWLGPDNDAIAVQCELRLVY